MWFSLNSFSQTVTETRQVPNKDTVKIHIDVAKKIAKDLSLLDAVKAENGLLKQNIDTLISQKNNKDSIISRKDEQIDLYKSSIKLYNNKELVYKSYINNLDLQLSKEKKKNKLAWTAAAAVVIYTFVKK